MKEGGLLHKIVLLLAREKLFLGVWNYQQEKMLVGCEKKSINFTES